MEKDARPRLREGLVIRDLGPERVIYDSEHDQVHVLNRTGRLVVELADGERTVPEITEALRARYVKVPDKSPEIDMRADVELFLATLAEKGLLEGLEE